MDCLQVQSSLTEASLPYILASLKCAPLDKVKIHFPFVCSLTAHIAIRKREVFGWAMQGGRRLFSLEIEEHRWSHHTSRDMFLFACYTGTAYIDVTSITNDNLSTDDSGAMWLKYRRGKNGKLCRVKLLPEAIALIEKYRNKSRETLFPVIKREAMMWNLNSLRGMAGIKGPLTYHMGRHSFSTLITLENGVPIETVSKMLGHSDIKTTQVYARVTPKKLFEDMDKYIEATEDLKLIL